MGANESCGSAVATYEMPDGALPLLPGGLPPGVVQALIFGDSWAEDNTQTEAGVLRGVQGWPGQLVRRLGIPLVGNYAKGQSESSSLMQQLEKAKAVSAAKDPLWAKSLVILHSGGNDFIGAEKGYNPLRRDNFWLKHCLWGFQQKADEVIGNLQAFLEQLHGLGCRHFLVSDLPFTSAVPALRVACAVKVDQRGMWLNARLGAMLEDFRASASDGSTSVGHIREVPTINRLVAARRRGKAASRLFLADMFHPTHDTHGLLAEAVAARLPAGALVGDAQEDARSPAAKACVAPPSLLVGGMGGPLRDDARQPAIEAHPVPGAVQSQFRRDAPAQAATG